MTSANWLSGMFYNSNTIRKEASTLTTLRWYCLYNNVINNNNDNISINNNANNNNLEDPRMLKLLYKPLTSSPSATDHVLFYSPHHTCIGYSSCTVFPHSSVIFDGSRLICSHYYLVLLRWYLILYGHSNINLKVSYVFSAGNKTTI